MAGLLRRDEAASYLQIGRTTLDALVRAREVAVVETRGGRRYRVEDLDAYIWRRRVGAKADREPAQPVSLPIAVPDGVVSIFTGRPLGRSSTGSAAQIKRPRAGGR